MVGRDMRVSSPAMSAAFVDGVLSRGADVIDIGLASTDELWFASGRLGLPGAMFTASHNPGEYNGIKFCLRRRAADRARRSWSRSPTARWPALPVPAARAGRADRAGPAAGVRRPPALAGRPDRHPPAEGGGRRRQRDGRAHPAGGARTSAIWSWSVSTPIPTARFPNHPPNPLEPENLVDAQRRGASITAPTSRWSSTATPTAASSSTSAARWSARRRSPP